eukprot:scaffold89681_cov24-Tisochrysis_lutea.AAC.1
MQGLRCHWLLIAHEIQPHRHLGMARARARELEQDVRPRHAGSERCHPLSFWLLLYPAVEC